MFMGFDFFWKNFQSQKFYEELMVWFERFCGFSASVGFLGLQVCIQGFLSLMVFIGFKFFWV